MSLTGIYNTNGNKRDERHYVEKLADNVLMTEYQKNGSYYQRNYFDFMTRTLTVIINGSQADRILTFDEVDPDVLKLHRDILIELGGHPQPLPDPMGKPRFGSPATP